MKDINKDTNKDTNKDIEDLLARYQRLESLVNQKLETVLDSIDIKKHITHRIKSIESMDRKIQLKSDHYNSIEELRDVLGFRVICYFQDDVDKAGRTITDNFEVDFSKFKDKSQLLDVRSFGYVSTHYICRLKEADDDLSDLWFEIQIRTVLQHCWAEIEHDLGYKSDIEVPRDIRRSFARVASLLETADDIFTDIRHQLDEYKQMVSTDIESGSFDSLYFDKLTIDLFTKGNNDYLELLEHIASITNANITQGSSVRYLRVMEYLGIRTFSEMIDIIHREHDLILKLATKALRDNELNEISSTVGYYYIIRAVLIDGIYSEEEIREAVGLITSGENLIDMNVDKILKERASLNTISI